MYIIFEIDSTVSRAPLSAKKLVPLLTNCGGPAITLQYTVSLVQWVNRLLPVWGVSGSRPGDAPILTMESGFSCWRCLATQPRF